MTKKEIRQSLHDTITQAIVKFDLSAPSKKIEKLTHSFSKKIASELKSLLKKKPLKKAAKTKSSQKVAKKKATKVS